MEAKELRIGNFVEYKGQIHIIKSLEDEFCEIDRGFQSVNYIPYADLKPLGINADTLSRLNFEYNETLRLYQFDKFEFRLEKMDEVGIVDGCEVTYAPCKYVHTLQNFIADNK